MALEGQDLAKWGPASMSHLHWIKGNLPLMGRKVIDFEFLTIFDLRQAPRVC